MRRFAAATLALPVIASIYLATTVAAVGARRFVAAIAIVVVVGALGVSAAPPWRNQPAAQPTRQAESGAAFVLGAKRNPTSTGGSANRRLILSVNSLPDPARIVPARRTMSAIVAIDTAGRGSLPPAPHVALAIARRQGRGPVVASTPVARALMAPALVRFQPLAGAGAVNSRAPISVRFNVPMNRASTSRAFALVIHGAKVKGTFSWTNDDTVLIFRPGAALPAGSGVGIRVVATAIAADGRPIVRGASATFKVATASRRSSSSGSPVKPAVVHPPPSKPVQAPKPIRTPKPRPVRKPVHATGPPGQIAGIDVSHHDGSIDWQAVATAGTAFAYMKASEGTAFVDPTYATNRARAEAAGLRVGAFHYAEPDASIGEAAAEADHFVATARFKKGELTPMLDLEVTNGLSPNELQAWVTSFLDRVYQRTGVRPGIYVSPSFWQTDLADSSSIAAAGYHDLWIADWRGTATPWVPASDWGGMGWTFWQYDHRAHVPGIAGPVDVDRFSGSDLASLLIR